MLRIIAELFSFSEIILITPVLHLVLTMSRSELLRKKLKDQVREKVTKEEEDRKKIHDFCTETFRTWRSSEDFPSFPGADNGLFEKLDRRRKANMEKARSIHAGRLAPNITYEESDQSPVKGLEAFLLSTDLGTGLDNSPVYAHLSDWYKTLFRGDYEKFLSILHDLSENEIKVLLTKRETLYNVPAVFHPINGASMLFSDDPMNQEKREMYRQQLDARDGHLRILIKLLTLGVDVNARDVGGRTPLHICCEGHGSEVTRKMAERLIRAGADVNAKNRCGETALFSSSKNSHIDIIQLLLANGADPSIRNNDGQTAYFLSPPSIRDFLGEFEKKRALEERKLSRKAVGGSFRQCGVCGVGVGEKVMKRCSGCYLFWYCGRNCQLDHWPEHQNDCKVRFLHFLLCLKLLLLHT